MWSRGLFFCDPKVNLLQGSEVLPGRSSFERSSLSEPERINSDGLIDYEEEKFPNGGMPSSDIPSQFTSTFLNKERSKEAKSSNTKMLKSKLKTKPAGSSTPRSRKGENSQERGGRAPQSD